MEVLAQRGNEYLVTKDAIADSDENPTVRMVNLFKGVSFIIPAEQALKLGYWEEVDAVPQDILTQIKAYYDNVAYDFIKDVAPQFVGKQGIVRTSYTVLESGKPIGVVTFGDVPAAEITSRNEKLIGIVTKTMVNSITTVDEEGGTIYATIGSPLYEDAVLALVKAAGFITVKR